jgi:putative membrane protein
MLVAFCGAVTAWSLIRPHSYDIWAFEIFAGIAGVAVLTALRKRFPFSNLVYLLAALHFVILASAAKYTYAEMPLFNWLRDVLGSSRNHFDRVGHFAQGFVPAVIAREVFLRATALERGRMLFFIVLCFCLAFSAFWELLEWWFVMAFYRQDGADWLGLQGDPWDAHWDMTMALLGAILAQALLAKRHDRSMAALNLNAGQAGDGS